MGGFSLPTRPEGTMNTLDQLDLSVGEARLLYRMCLNSNEETVADEYMICVLKTLEESYELLGGLINTLKEELAQKMPED